MVDRPWMEAIEKQFAWAKYTQRELQTLKQAQARKQVAPAFAPVAPMLVAELEQMVAMLTCAAPYIWSAETTAAAQSAASTIPHDQPFTADLLPTAMGWWYFPPDSLRITTEPPATGPLALAWHFVPNGLLEQTVPPLQPLLGRPVRDLSGPAVNMYLVQCEHREHSPTGYVWLIGETLTQRLALIGRRQSLVDEYHEITGGVWSPPPEQTLRDLMTFFFTACVWLRQKLPVLVTSSGPIERHQRKRFARELHMDNPPSEVKIVELRRRESQPHAVSGEQPVEWSCQWPVEGHWTHQPYGPGSSERRLMYINPYIKGPSDKPLRLPKRTVYVVDR